MKPQNKPCICALLALSLCSITLAKTIYVDSAASGSNDGSSWEDAYTALQDALAESKFGDEIHVAEGIYRPDQGVGQTPGDRTASFELKNGIKVYGGFQEGGEIWENREPSAYLTILSGDLNQDDAEITNPANLLNEPSRTENSYHVVKATLCAPITILDGFIIQDGNANGSAPDDAGGGMYNYINASPTIINCIFTRNAAQNVGGSFVTEEYRSKPILQGCCFVNSWAENGGAVCSRSSSVPDFQECYLEYNKSGTNGGAIFCTASGPFLSGCNFKNNIAGGSGGAVHAQSNSHLNFSDCAFEKNQCSANGGAVSFSGGSHSLTGCNLNTNIAGTYGGAIFNDLAICNNIFCDFTSNTAHYGGAMYNLNRNTDSLNCTFMNNSANSGGAVYSFASEVNLTIVSNFTNCLFSANEANGADGGVVLLKGDVKLAPTRYGKSNGVFTNCTLASNFALRYGGGIRSEDDWNEITIKNAILWDNVDTAGSSRAQSAQVSYGIISASYSCIQGISSLAGNNNIGEDPLFVDVAGPDWLPGTGDEDIRISASSPCIDAGNNDAVPADSQDIDDNGNTAEPLPWDLDGIFRFIDDPSTPDTGNGTAPIVDMGCYEYDNFGQGRCGDRNHPYPAYDFNQDCKVNLADFVLFVSQWLVCTAPDC